MAVSCQPSSTAACLLAVSAPSSLPLLTVSLLLLASTYLRKLKSWKNQKVQVWSAFECPWHQETLILYLLQVDLHLAQNKYSKSETVSVYIR